MRVLQGNPPWACLRIRHELLRPVSAMGFQQLGRPVGNPPYHPDGPPWLAGSGLRRWYTYLVYLQQWYSIKINKYEKHNLEWQKKKGQNKCRKNKRIRKFKNRPTNYLKKIVSLTNPTFKASELVGAPKPILVKTK
jgi:hypothetical protein